MAKKDESAYVRLDEDTLLKRMKEGHYTPKGALAAVCRMAGVGPRKKAQLKQMVAAFYKKHPEAAAKKAKHPKAKPAKKPAKTRKAAKKPAKRKAAKPPKAKRGTPYRSKGVPFEVTFVRVCKDKRSKRTIQEFLRAAADRHTIPSLVDALEMVG